MYLAKKCKIMQSILNFTHQYQLSKTLRFELVPIGKTRENIEKKGYIAKDFSRSELLL
jgi:CRISPR-associated protein Cpf1